MNEIINIFLIQDFPKPPASESLESIKFHFLVMFIELPHEIVELKFSCILRGYWCINQPIDLDKLQGVI